jgi:hypothetical protein
MRTAWVNRIVIVALVGGLWLMDYGFRVTPAAAEPLIKESALPGITQNWDKSLPSASRFTVLTAFGAAAVRDNKTGLVWEQAPDGATRTWESAPAYCVNKNIGGTVGWRLPSVVELKSVQDPTLPAPLVPASVFTSVQSGDYWSASTYVSNPITAWVVDFNVGYVFSDFKTFAHFAWCVRGPMNADAY